LQGEHFTAPTPARDSEQDHGVLAFSDECL
jgi:hypothetical protein